MTTFGCPECGRNWQEGPTRDYTENYLCRKCTEALARRAGEALEKLTTCSCPKQALCIFSPQLGCERCALIHDLRAAGLLDEGREG